MTAHKIKQAPVCHFHIVTYPYLTVEKIFNTKYTSGGFVMNFVGDYTVHGLDGTELGWFHTGLSKFLCALTLYIVKKGTFLAGVIFICTVICAVTISILRGTSDRLDLDGKQLGQPHTVLEILHLR